MADTRDPRALTSEIKFLVDADTAQQLRDWTRQHLAADPHGGGAHGDEYRTTSLYLDTSRFDVFHRRGSFGRAKYRIRRYGESATVFLERKLRQRQFLHKRRTTVGLPDLGRLQPGGPEPDDWDGYWFWRRMRARTLHPVCEIAYVRTARGAVTDAGPVRVTIDADVQARTARGLDFSMAAGIPVLGQKCVVEMKFRREAPALLRRAVEDFRLGAIAVSKYRASIDALGLTPSEHADAGALHA